MKKKSLVVIALTILFFKICYCIFLYNFKYEEFKNKKITVSINKISEIGEEGITYDVTYNNDKFLMYIKDKDEILKGGEKIQCIASNYKIETKNNPYEFNYKRYLNSNKYISRLYCSKIILKENGKNKVLDIIYAIREYISKKLDKKMDAKNSNLLKSMMYGDNLFLDEKIKKNFSDIGLSHVLAVSGAHIEALLFSYEKIVNNRKRIVSNIILIFYFFCISLFNVSLLRAMCMYILSVIFKNKYSFVQKYVITLMIFIYINPYYIFNAGIIFSFLSILGIKLFYTLIYSYIITKLRFKYNSALKVIVKNISLTVSAQILTFPFQIYYFNKFSIIFLFSNLLLSFLIEILMHLNFSLFILFFIPYISDILIYSCNFLITIVVKLVEIINKINYFSIYLIRPSISIFFCYYVFIVVMLYKKYVIILSWKNRKKLKKLALKLQKCFCIYILTWYLYMIFLDKYVIFFNVGQGNMSLIHSNTKNIIVDIGATKEYDAGNIIVSFLKAKNINKVDAIFITHMHSDHINGIANLLENNIKIGYIVYSKPPELTKEYTELIEIAKNKKIALVQVTQLDNIKIEKINVDVLSPPKNSYIKDSDILNANSTIYLVDTSIKKIMYMGDSTKETEKYLLNEYINSEREEVKKIKETINNLDIYQVGHHGSKTSTYEVFISKINSCNAIISADKNVYGHPNDEVLDILNKYKFKILITQKKGAIKF